jgi:hypothetical protein
VTNAEWESELAAALAGSGWVADLPCVAQNSSRCFADLKHVATGVVKPIQLARDQFPTVESRRAEILRLLSI